jgi:ribonuclease VapC
VIVDTSALVAILRREPRAPEIDDLLWERADLKISAASYVELGAVTTGLADEAMRRRAEAIVDDYGITVEPVTAEQARIAREAYRDLGKGSGHPARLNFGDVFAYALATTTREPLLFVGDDFARTDVTPALPPA